MAVLASRISRGKNRSLLLIESFAHSDPEKDKTNLSGDFLKSRTCFDAGILVSALALIRRADQVGEVFSSELAMEAGATFRQ